MKLLDNLINEHFLPSANEEINNLFHKHDIFNLISKTSEHLKSQMQKAIISGGEAPITTIATSGSNFLVSVNNQLIKIDNQQEKRKVQEALGQIGIRLLLSIVKLFPEQAVEIFDQVKQTLLHTSEIFNYDYADINELMKFEEYEELIQTLTGSKQARELKKIDQQKKVLCWTDRVNIGLLTSELKRNKWIRSQNEFAKLFEDPKNTLKVHWDMKYKYELAHLLLRLKDGDFIRPKKGFFNLIEKYIVDFAGRSLPKNSLKKISSKITTNPSKYCEIINSIEEIMKPLSN